MKKTLWNTLALTISALLILDSIRIITFGGYDPSKWFSALFGCGLLVFTLLYNILLIKQKFLARCLLALFIVFLSSFVVVEGLLLSGASQKTESGDALIVLGGGLAGYNPGPLLRLRLNAAYDFLQANPQAVCVVSGGQGADEIISEANAMANYLINKGIATERIILEDQATNTIENFSLSKVLLEEYFQGQEYQAVYVTNTFHVYRSGLISQQAGLKANGLAAPTVWTVKLNYYLREYCSLVYYWLFK